MADYNFETVWFRHGRPQGSDRFNIQASDLDEAVVIAVAAESSCLDELPVGEAENVEIHLFAVYGGHSEPVMMWNGEEWSEPCECEACGDLCFDTGHVGAIVCPRCEADWDDDSARSYGPGREVARIRGMREEGDR